MAQYHIGTSGWNYKHWKSAFYPDDLAEKDWLSHYSQFFQTVEINYSFYRLPTRKSFKAWHKESPKDFLFAVKGNRFITHIKKLNKCTVPLKRFLGRARELKEKLGPILFQLPPGWKVNAERLESFLSLLPKDLKFVFEFRNETWNTEEIFKMLTKHKVAYCIMSAPHLPRIIKATAPFAYVRMHGAEAIYQSNYPENQLKSWAKELKALGKEAREVYIYFNNDALGFAVKNGLKLKELLKA